MKNFTMKLAATLLIFSGCAQNDLIDSPDQGTSNDGKVRFSATSALTGTRAADGNPFNNTQALQTLGSFTIDGYYKDASIYGVTKPNVAWNGGSWEYANEPYWPTGDGVKINFFAYANWEDTNTKLTFASTGITAAHKDGGVNNITIAEDKLDGSGQKDLLVGGQMGATKQSRTLITFKHALTQVVFKAGNVNSSRLDVKIGGVRIVNVDNAASQMTFNGTKIAWTLSGTADAKYHVQGLEAATDWSNPINIDKTKAYTAPIDATLGDYSNYTVIQKTAGAKNNALLLLPQKFAAWDPNNAGGGGSYIELLAVVKDKTNASDTNLANAGNTTDVDNLKPYYYCGTPIYVSGANTESYGIIRIPVSSVADDLGEWIAGKRITYLITFGDSGSGSGGGGYNPGGDPILVPIRFNAIVENWVDVNVPLLTATFNANSGSVDGTFIDGYTNQLINDIKSARTPKVYKSSIKVTGQLSQTSANQKITVSGLNDNNILVGSTVTYDFTGIDVWNKTLTIDALPDGWSAKYYKDNTATEVTGSTELDGENINIVVLTKTSELDANITYSSVAPEYISDFISAIRINEGTTVRADEWVINVTGTITKNITFSADELTLLGGTPGTSKVTVNLSSVTFSSGKLSVIVPAGWKATLGSATKYVGETLEATANTSNITFIKL